MITADRIASPFDAPRISRIVALRAVDAVARAYDLNAPRPMVSTDGETVAGDLTLAFAGTRCLGDWSLDGEAWRVVESWTAGAGVHKGWAGLTDHVYADALAACQGVSGYNIVTVTGHSLGAALALLTAFRLAQDLVRRRPTIRVVAFGCPRVGDRAFHAAYHDRGIPTLRVTCAHDPVAHAPGFWGWRHVGEQLHLDEDGTVLPDPSGWWGRMQYWLGWNPRHLDHSITGYQLALRANQERGLEWPA